MAYKTTIIADLYDETTYQAEVVAEMSIDDYSTEKVGTNWTSFKDNKEIIKTTSPDTYIARSLVGADYIMRELLLRFDTSFIPSNATLGTTAEIIVEVILVNNGSTLSLVVDQATNNGWGLQGKWARDIDIATQWWDTSRGTATLASQTVGRDKVWPILPGLIDRTGVPAYTNLRIAIGRNDGTHTAPTTNNNIDIRTSENIDGDGPVLRFTYTVPKKHIFLNAITLPRKAAAVSPVVRADYSRRVSLPVPPAGRTIGTAGILQLGKRVIIPTVSCNPQPQAPVLNLNKQQVGPLTPPASRSGALPPLIAAKAQKVDLPTLTKRIYTGSIRVGKAQKEIEEPEQSRNRKIRNEIVGANGITMMDAFLYKSNDKGENVKLLEGVTSLDFNMSNFREATWEMSVTLDRQKGFDPFSDWAKIVIESKVLGVGIVRWPLGLYRFVGDDAIGGAHGRESSTWELTGQSAEVLLLNDTTRGVYTVKKGTKILNKVRNILIGKGIPANKISLPMHQDKELNTTLIFDPFQEEEAGNMLGIVNALLDAGGWYALYTLASGDMTTYKVRDTDDVEPAVFYGPPDRGGEPMITSAGIADSYNLEGWANAVLVTSEDPNQKPKVLGVAENRDPHSPSSYNELQYWKIKRVQYKHIADQEAADKLARAQLKSSSRRRRSVSFSAYADPEREPKEYLRLYHETDEGLVNGKWRVANMGGSLYPAPRQFEYEVSKAEEA